MLNTFWGRRRHKQVGLPLVSGCAWLSSLDTIDIVLSDRQCRVNVRNACSGFSFSLIDTAVYTMGVHFASVTKSKFDMFSPSYWAWLTYFDSFDVELPIDCDDEYWETGNPDTDFKQPPGRLSHLGAFLHHLRLSTVISFAMRTLYGIRKSKKAAGLTTNAMDDSVSIIDSMLNSWFNAIPPHLRWEPSSDPNPYFAESAMLYMSYYMLQMLVHRPFIHKTTPQSLPSSAICTNAARSLSRLLECWSQRKLVSSFVVNVRVSVSHGELLTDVGM